MSMALLMIIIALTSAWLQRPFTARPSRWVWDISYAI
jgi:hypothetical protein